MFKVLGFFCCAAPVLYSSCSTPQWAPAVR